MQFAHASFETHVVVFQCSDAGVARFQIVLQDSIERLVVFYFRF